MGLAWSGTLSGQIRLHHLPRPEVCRFCGTILRVAFDEDLAYRLRELLQAEEGLTEKRMFGGLAFLIHGHMAVSASGQGGLLLRAEPSKTDELLRQAHTHPFVMRGREMDGWLKVDDDGLRTKRQLERWLRIGVAYVRSLPPKS